MRNSVRFLIAVLAVLAVGLFIYFENPAPDQPKNTAPKAKQEKEKDTESARPKIDVSIPDLKPAQADGTIPVEKLEKSARSMHATMNHVASEGAFDGEALNTGKIKQDLQKMTIQLNETKNACGSTCSKDFSAYLNKMDQLSALSAEGNAQALAELYANISRLDQKLNGAEALADVRSLEDIFDEKLASDQFKNINQWIKDAQARLDAQTGDLSLGNTASLEEKAKAAEAKLAAARKKAEAAKKRADQLKQAAPAERQAAEKKAKEALKKAEQLQAESEAARQKLAEAKKQAKDAQQDTAEFAKQAKQYADQFKGKDTPADTKAQLDQIQKLADSIAKNGAGQQEQIEALRQAFERLNKLKQTQ